MSRIFDEMSGKFVEVDFRDVLASTREYAWDEEGRVREASGHPSTWEEFYAKNPHFHRDVPEESRPKGSFTEESILGVLDRGWESPVGFLAFRPLRTREDYLSEAITTAARRRRADRRRKTTRRRRAARRRKTHVTR